MNPTRALALVKGEDELLARALETALGSAAEADKFLRLALNRVEVDADEWPEEEQPGRLILRLVRETLEEYLSRSRYQQTFFGLKDEALALPALTRSMTGAPEDERVARAVSASGPLGRLILELAGTRRVSVKDLCALTGLSKDHVSLFLHRSLDLAQFPDPGKHIPSCEGLGTSAARGCVPCKTRDEQLALLGASARTYTSEVTVIAQANAAGSVGGGGAGSESTAVRPTRSMAAAGGYGASGGTPTVTGPRRTSLTERPAGTAAGRGGNHSPGTPGRTETLKNVSLAVLGFVLAVGWVPMRASTPTTAPVDPGVSGLVTPRPVEELAPADAVARVTHPNGATAWLKHGQGVWASPMGPAMVVYQDGTRAQLDAGSAAVVFKRGLTLEKGVARLDVTSGETPFSAKAHPLKVDIRQGKFLLTKPEQGITRLASGGGSANVTSLVTGGSVAMGSGQRLDIGKDGGFVVHEDDAVLRMDAFSGDGGDQGTVISYSEQRPWESLPQLPPLDITTAGSAAGGDPGSAPDRPRLDSTSGGGSSGGSDTQGGKGGSSGVGGYRNAF